MGTDRGADVTASPSPGLVGRTVMTRVHRDGDDGGADEPCEVVACQVGGEYGSWHILVATHDGHLLEVGPSKVTLVADPSGEGPYR